MAHERCSSVYTGVWHCRKGHVAITYPVDIVAASSRIALYERSFMLPLSMPGGGGEVGDQWPQLLSTKSSVVTPFGEIFREATRVVGPFENDGVPLCVPLCVHFECKAT